jgi:histidinol-phosphate aminotransferase
MLRGVLEVLQPYEAGISVDEVSLRGRKPVKLNSNENPYPPPAAVIRAASEALKKANRYPDFSYRRLKEKLSGYTGLPTENITVGSGASEVLDNVCKAVLEPLDRVVQPVPGYTMHLFLSMIRDVSPVYVETEKDGFKIRAGNVLAASRDAKLVFLCSPNNPTGMSIDRQDIIDIVEGTRAVVVIDEAYYEFCGKTVADSVLDHDNLIVIRSMSKFFALAGLRVGYALASREVAQNLEKVRLPFSISLPAAEAAMKALESLEYYEDVKKGILMERERVLKRIREIGLEVYPSEANFLLVRLPDKPSGDELNRALMAQGIFVRNVSRMPGLSRNYLRITIGRRQENNRMLSGLKKLFSSC